MAFFMKQLPKWLPENGTPQCTKKLDHFLSTNHILVESENIPTYCLYFTEVPADSLEVGPI
jgi:hypothetical protein